ncbi:MAG TPA: S41 family peptidase, partial [Fimbriimonas sp.]|nr:S41 family peptidase [Fimbriimonas sp.]
ASNADMAHDGETFAWTRFNRASDAWFRYKGGMQNQIWTGNTKTNVFKQLTNVTGTNEFPAWLDKSIYFINENDGKFQLMSVNPESGRTEKLASPSAFEMRELNAGPGGVVYEKGAGAEIYDPATKLAKPLQFDLTSDRLYTKPFQVLAEPHFTNLSITPTGKRVLAEARGQIINLPVGSGEVRLWKSQPGTRLRMPLTSPDGKKVSYFSDELGNENLYVANADGSMPKALTNSLNGRLVNQYWSPDGKWIALNDSEMRFRLINVETGEDRLLLTNIVSWSGTSFDFSPDSKWIAYAELDMDSQLPHLVLYNIEKKEKTPLGNALSNDTAPAFSRDGKYLGFLSNRNLAVDSDPILNQLNLGPTVVPCLLALRKDVKSPLAQKDPAENEPKAEAPKEVPFSIDLEGLYQRFIVVPGAAGKYSGTAFAGSRFLFGDGSKIDFYDVAAQKAGNLTTGKSFWVSADQSKVLVDNRVVDATAEGAPPTAGRLASAGFRITIDPVKEWKQIYWEAWRLLRDYFYVANMHGLDWKAIGDKYAPMLESVRSRYELDILIRWLQAELGTSHQYLNEGDERNIAPKISGAFLGIEVVANQGRLQISKIYKGDNFLDSERSPLLEPGLNVKEGDYLLAIGGQELTDTSNYLSMLGGRAGQTVSLTINDKPEVTGSRSVLVKTVANELRMKRLDWVEENRQAVAKATNGKVGYLYLGAMTAGDMSDFIRQYFPQRNKDAIIVDARFNNGGFVQNSINRILGEKLTGFFNMRASQSSWTRQGDYFAGHIALLQNEFNVSCGEEFPHKFRELKRGVIIGRRTYGGEVGSDPGWPLVDGGVLSVPNYGMWTPKDGWVIEGPGVEPDIDVQSDPNHYAKGGDAQLERAIQWTLAELKKNPIVRPKQPADPVKVKPGG